MRNLFGHKKAQKDRKNTYCVIANLVIGSARSKQPFDVNSQNFPSNGQNHPADVIVFPVRTH
jgi:hypothetical protein